MLIDSARTPIAPDVSSADLEADPAAVVDRLRATAPVWWVPELDRFIVVGYEECVRVETHPEIYSSREDGHRLDRTIGASMIRKDAPEHTAERRAANRALRVRAVQDEWRPVFQSNAERFLDELLDAGPGADLSSVFSLPLAAANVAAVVGLGHIPASTVGGWSSAFMAGAANYLEDEDVWTWVADVNAEIDAAIDEVAGELRDTPDRSLLSAMIQAGFPVETQRANVKLAISGGINEPKHAITTGVWAFQRHPDQLRIALDDPDRFESAFDEIVRWQPPITMNTRRPVTDTDLAGVPIPRGALVSPHFVSANRDPARFADPTRFDITRDSSGHLAFGAGAHMCAGRWVAQASVGQIALPLLYDRLPGLAPADPSAARFEGLVFRGLSELPVTWDAAAAAHRRRTARPGELATHTDLEVQALHREAPEVVRLVLTPADGSAPRPWDPGAHLPVRLPSGLERHYSLCNRGEDRDTYEIAVLRERDGRGGSAEIHSTVRVGDRLSVGHPRTNFAWTPARRYRFVAGGIGITPILPMLDAAERAGADWELLYLGRERAGMAFADALAALGDRVTIWPKSERGRADLGHLVPTPSDGELVYACGPASLLDELEERSLVWPAGALRVERFVARDTDLPREPFRLRLARSERVLDVPAESTIVEVLEQAGIEVATSCLEGTCRTCETRVLAGTPCHRDAALSLAERRESATMMICVSRARSEELTIDR